jgi:NAD(P)-dependent dehydrogenase (short-subunit alcohol dehydrogenase family)
MSAVSYLPDFGLDGKVAIVTGASSGFGDRFVRTLVEAGASVVAVARRVDRLDALAAEVDGVAAMQCDVSRDDDLRRVVAATLERFGRIDVVVNNAGMSDATGARADQQDPAAFRSVVEVNLNACFVLASLAAASMIERGEGGSIINISSIHGIVSSAPNHQAAYVASKAGLIGLTKELAGQWARFGIRVNSIAPGYFETELTAPLFEGDGAAGGQRYIERGTMMRRAGVAGELDGTLLLLASAAGSYITGQTIAVDGGWTAK